MDSTYSLADALAGLEKEKYARDPFRIVGSGLAGALTNAVNPQTYTGNPWSAIGAQFGASLLGSALEQQGLDRVRGQMAGYAKELGEIGQQPFQQQLESLNANPDYQSLVPYFTEEEMRRQEERRKLTDALVATRAKALLEASLSPPKRSTIMEGDQRITQEWVPSAGKWTTVAEAPRKVGTNAGDAEAADFKLIGEATKELRSSQEYKAFENLTRGIRSVEVAMTKNDPVTDLELVRSAIQAIEPGMAVKEGEYEGVLAAQSWPSQVKGQMLRTLRGESGLLPQTKSAIYDLVKRRWAAGAENMKLLEGMQRKILTPRLKTAQDFPLIPYDIPALEQQFLMTPGKNKPDPLGIR